MWSILKEETFGLLPFPPPQAPRKQSSNVLSEYQAVASTNVNLNPLPQISWWQPPNTNWSVLSAPNKVAMIYYKFVYNSVVGEIILNHKPLKLSNMLLVQFSQRGRIYGLTHEGDD